MICYFLDGLLWVAALKWLCVIICHIIKYILSRAKPKPVEYSGVTTLRIWLVLLDLSFGRSDGHCSELVLGGGALTSLVNIPKNNQHISLGGSGTQMCECLVVTCIVVLLF